MVLVVAAAFLIGSYSFCLLFSRFAFYDDEGYFLQAYRDFLSGRPLYDQVFSMYGPLTFFVSRVLAGFHAQNVTSDALRWITWPGWIAAAGLFAAVVWRLTRQFTVSILAFVVVGVRLSYLSESVGHPQLWIILAAAGILMLGVNWIGDANQKARAFILGALIGAVILFKINIGIFVLTGVALAVGLHGRGRRRMLACALPIAAACALGMALLAADSTPSEKYFAVVYLASLALTAGVTVTEPAEREPVLSNLDILAAGLFCSIGAAVFFTLASGTSLRGLAEGLVTGPASLVNSYHYPFLEASDAWSLLLCVSGLGAAAVTFHWRSMFRSHPSRLGWLKLTAGMLVLFSLHSDPRKALCGSLLFLWLLIVDDPCVSRRDYSDRLLLAVLGPVFSLQLFPIAGSQVDWAALMPMTAAAVLLGDGVSAIRTQFVIAYQLLDAGESHGPLRPGIRLGANAVPVLALGFVFLITGSRTWAGMENWRRMQPLGMPGAHWLRLPASDAATMSAVVGSVRQNCQSVLTVPGMYSIVNWSGVPPFEEKRFNSWVFLWPDEVRRDVIPRLRKQSRGCVLLNRVGYEFYRDIAVSPGNDALVREIRQTMKPIDRVQEFTLYRSSEAPALELPEAANLPAAP